MTNEQYKNFNHDLNQIVRTELNKSEQRSFPIHVLYV